MTPQYTMSDLREIRTKMGATQTRMASAMGMALRTYQALEGGPNAIKPYHMKAAWFAALQLSDGNGGRDNLPVELGELVRRIYEGTPSARK